jgi:hypothetical protein
LFPLSNKALELCTSRADSSITGGIRRILESSNCLRLFSRAVTTIQSSALSVIGLLSSARVVIKRATLIQSLTYLAYLLSSCSGREDPYTNLAISSRSALSSSSLTLS